MRLLRKDAKEPPPITRTFESSRHDHANLANAFEQAMPVIRRSVRPAASPPNCAYRARRVGS